MLQCAVLLLSSTLSCTLIARDRLQAHGGVPLASVIALVASSGPAKQTNPKPRLTPFSLRMTLALEMTPYCENSCLSFSSSTVSSRFFTYRLLCCKPQQGAAGHSRATVVHTSGVLNPEASHSRRSTAPVLLGRSLAAVMQVYAGPRHALAKARSSKSTR